MKDIKQAHDAIIELLQNQLSMSGQDTYILGLSGGIDSTLTLALAVEAVGADKVKVFSMPYFKNLETTDKAMEIASHFNVWKMLINIKPIVDMYNVNVPYRLGNIMARTRMTILYDYAMVYRGLVLNTCNLSEDLVGYATKYGDAAGDIAPIAHLTKTEVYAMAEYMNIPESLINRTPSAELWNDQTDEGELGFTYAQLDSVIDCFLADKPACTPVSDLYIWMSTVDTTMINIPIDIWNSIKMKNILAQHKLTHMPSLV